MRALVWISLIVLSWAIFILVLNALKIALPIIVVFFLMYRFIILPYQKKSLSPLDNQK